jgi:hypothetical protein
MQTTINLELIERAAKIAQSNNCYGANYTITFDNVLEEIQLRKIDDNSTLIYNEDY